MYCSGFLLGPGLLSTEGEQHRKQRKMLTPVFSIAYLRNVTTLFYETSFKVSFCLPCGARPPNLKAHSQLRNALLGEVCSGTKEIDVLKWTSRAALELVGQGALGYSFDPLVEDVADPFAEAVKSFLWVTPSTDIFLDSDIIRAAVVQ